MSCQLQDPYNNHGILFLENRSKKLIPKETNQNDVLKIIGQPHTKSIDDENIWIYLERTLTKGKLFEAPSSGFGSEYAADNIPIIKDMDPLSKAVYNTVAPYGEKAFDIIDTVYRMFGATAADIAQVAGVDEKDVKDPVLI